LEKYRNQSGRRIGEKRISSPLFSPRKKAGASSTRRARISAPVAAFGSCAEKSLARRSKSPGGGPLATYRPSTAIRWPESASFR